MPRPFQHLPEDFHLYAASEGNLKLRKRYNACGATIERWRRQIGVRYVSPAMPKPSRPMKARKARNRWAAQERIEDIDDGFDLASCLRTGGAGAW